jgi:16S rRNA (uracil1498-N3)-methyltransferase
MHRFYLPPPGKDKGPPCPEPSRREEAGAAPGHGQAEALFLTGREAHHAVDVLRLRRGDTVRVLDGAGQERLCLVGAADRHRVSLSVLEKRSLPPPPCRVTLLQAIPKGRLFEAIVQKATELGAWRIVPLLSQRVVVRLDPQEAVRRAEKWQWAAIAAIKQCGAAWLPRVERPLTPAQFLARQEPCELSLLASLQPGSRHPRECFRAFQAAHGRNPQTLCVWIGPEGDFTPEETEAIQAAGALPVSLGPLVLRTETAATYCLSVVDYELRA